jgi:2-polyprenyl-6-hydroxyphenyl methylase / 3-demethylubiquinone-9 3-methyltransferase
MANLDSQEIAKFSKLAAEWWDRDGSFKSLHDINPLRVGFIQQHVALTNKKVLDIGCGGGILSESLAQLGAQVTAIDMSAEVLNTARLHQAQNPLGIDYQQISAEDMALQQPNAFDVITCMELLEHVPDPASLIKACATLVKPDGAVFFSTINRNPKAYLFAIVAAEYLLNLLPKGTHDYAKFIRPSELSRWARDNDLTVQALQGMSYQPLTKQYYLSNDIGVNYLAYCKR